MSEKGANEELALSCPRLGWRREVLLGLLKALSNHQLLFASLVSSCFLIYLDPIHPDNSVHILVINQLSAAVLSYWFRAWLESGYFNAALALVSVIAVMLAPNTMHLSAVGTGFSFMFQAGIGEGSLALFGLAVGPGAGTAGLATRLSVSGALAHSYLILTCDAAHC
jgi:hypothetical protein